MRKQADYRLFPLLTKVYYNLMLIVYQTKKTLESKIKVNRLNGTTNTLIDYFSQFRYYKYKWY